MSFTRGATMPERKNTARQAAEKKSTNPMRKKNNPTQMRTIERNRKIVKDASKRGTVGMDRIESQADRNKLNRAISGSGTRSRAGERLREGKRKSNA
jgi:hypothetical protein